MKIRTAKYIFKEGANNAYRNKLMSLASISIIVASLFVLGLFYILSVNLNNNAKTLNEEPEIRVFCNPDADDTVLDAIENAIKGDPRVKDYVRVNKDTALLKAGEIFGLDADMMEGMDSDFMSVTFNIHLKDPTQSAAAEVTFRQINGVENVRYSQIIIDFIQKITYWIRIVCTVLIAILLVISVFIIANTIKLTVFARRREINIMKFVGATDWFIRWPFLVEGVIIGCVGAIAAFILLSYSYNALEGRFSIELADLSFNFIKLLKLREIGLQVLGIFTVIGMVVGALGSLISIRRHLRV